MSIIEATEFEGIDKPELFFGLAAAVGAPLSVFAPLLVNALSARGYVTEIIQLSDFLAGFKLPTPHPPPSAREYQRIDALMSRGNELRQMSGGSDALALLFAARIQGKRPDRDAALSGRAFVIRQMKHPDEVVSRRRVYGNAFHLIGLYSPTSDRKRYLIREREMSEDEADKLIKRDEGEDIKWGQQLRNTFSMADVFMEMRESENSTALVLSQISRFLDILFGADILSPTRDEYGMYLAYAAALRSIDLSRQVGASIVDPHGELVSLGANEVPAFGGGQYWGPPNDQRDAARGYDSNERMKRDAVVELLPFLYPGWGSLSEEQRMVEQDRIFKLLEKTRAMNLTEFGRAVHAEMEAILSAARKSTSMRKGKLYTTTFPCHNCTKHIIDAGIDRVVYIEPYAKSLAGQLHDDAISLAEDGVSATGKVLFEPFVGVAPRRYSLLFSGTAEDGHRFRRKFLDGSVDRTPLGLRLKASPLTYIDREQIAALAAKRFAQLNKEDHGEGIA